MANNANNVNDANGTITSNQNRTWWQQRTRMERTTVLLVLVAIIVVIGLTVGLILVIQQNIKYQDEIKLQSMCKTANVTSGYVEAAAHILRHINQSADPCDDFYLFACGRFLKDTEIPDDKTEVNAFETLRDLVQKQLKTIMEEPSETDEPRPFSLVKTLYNVCMNTTAIEDNALEPLYELLDEMGGWPVLEGDNWRDDDFDWKELLYKFRKNGLDINQFFKFEISPDWNNSVRNIIFLDQIELTMGRASVLRELHDNNDYDQSIAYYNYMVDLAVLLGAQRETAENEVKEVKKFRTQFFNIIVPKDNRQNVSSLNNVMTIRNLQRKHTSINWLELLNGLIALPIQALRHSDSVVVTHPKHPAQLEHLLKSSKRTLANYAFFNIITELALFLPKDIRDREQEFNSESLGLAAQKPRWKKCVAFVSKRLDVATAALYVRRYSNEDIKQSVTKLAGDLKNEVLNIIRKIGWMDEDTREKAIEKVEAITTDAAYAGELLDDVKLEEYYEGLEFHSENILELKHKIDKFKVDKNFGLLWLPVNKTDWRTRSLPTTVNAQYVFEENSIQLPAAILQEMFFDKDRPQYMNYAALSYIIGHEMTHGFDDQGRQYNKDGNVINWWAEETDAAFRKKIQCLIGLYGSHTVPEVNLQLDRVNMQDERIADYGRIKEAYLAYNSWIERNGVEPSLPGLNYTAKQLFWISAATVWCSKERPLILEYKILKDEHIPEHYRVTMPFRNTDYFSKDFNCPIGSNMNPNNKCHFW